MTTTTPKKPKVTNAALAAKLKEHGQLIDALRDDHEVLRRHVNDPEHALASRAILEKRIEETTKYVDEKLLNLAQNTSRELREDAHECAVTKNESHMLSSHIGELDMRLSMRCQDIEKKVEVLEKCDKNNVTAHNLLVCEVRDICTTLDSARSHLATKAENDLRDFELHKGLIDDHDSRLDKHHARLNEHQEQLDLFKCERCPRPQAATSTRRLYASALREARDTFNRSNGLLPRTAVTALREVCAGSLLVHAVDELYDVVDFIFTLPFRNEPDMNHHQHVELLSAWSLGASTEDIVSAFDIAIKRCST